MALYKFFIIIIIIIIIMNTNLVVVDESAAAAGVILGRNTEVTLNAPRTAPRWVRTRRTAVYTHAYTPVQPFLNVIRGSVV